MSLYSSHRDVESFDFKRSYWHERPRRFLCGTLLTFHRLGAFRLKILGEVPRAVVCGPGITGCDVGAGIECEPDQVLEVQDRNATLAHVEVNRGRGEQFMESLQPLGRQAQLDLRS